MKASLVLSVLLFRLPQELVAQATIVVATDATWPPMEFVAEDGSLQGFDVDLLTAAASAGGFRVTFVNVPWDGIFAYLLAGKCDAVASSVTITAERRKEMEFTIPYINAGQILIVRSSADPTLTLADLSGMPVGAQLGTAGQYFIQAFPDVKLRTYDDLDDAFVDLSLARLSGAVCDLPLAAKYAYGDQRFLGDFQLAGDPLNLEEYGVAIRKGNVGVLDALNAGLRAVLGSDVYFAFCQRWLGGRGMLSLEQDHSRR
jgi:polar amino acid transport system substrate-binding protein